MLVSDVEDTFWPFLSGVEAISIAGAGLNSGEIASRRGDDGTEEALKLLFSVIGEWVFVNLSWGPKRGLSLDGSNQLIVNWVSSVSSSGNSADNNKL